MAGNAFCIREKTLGFSSTVSSTPSPYHTIGRLRIVLIVVAVVILVIVAIVVVVTVVVIAADLVFIAGTLGHVGCGVA